MTQEIGVYTPSYVHMDASTFTEGNISTPQDPRQKMPVDICMSSCSSLVTNGTCMSATFKAHTQG